MGRFDEIENKMKKAIKSAPLQSGNKETKNMLIYNIPKEWSEILKAHGLAFSTYAKMAIFEKMKKDGFL